MFSPSQSAPSLFLKSNFEYLRGNYRKAVKLLNSANIAEHPGFMKTGKIKTFHPAGTSKSSIKGLLVDISFKDINDYLTVSALKVMGLYAGCISSCTLSHNTTVIFIVFYRRLWLSMKIDLWSCVIFARLIIQSLKWNKRQLTRSRIVASLAVFMLKVLFMI